MLRIVGFFLFLAGLLGPVVPIPQASEVVALASLVDAMNVDGPTSIAWSPEGFVTKLIFACTTDAKGVIPSPMGFQRLEELVFDSCPGIEGTFDLAVLRGLRRLEVLSTNFFGHLDLGASFNASKLEILCLRDTKRVTADIGTFPTVLPQLTELQLEDFLLEGEISPGPWHAPKLKSFTMEMVLVRGPIPRFVDSLALERLSIVSSKVEGSLEPLCALQNRSTALSLVLDSLLVDGPIPECLLLVNISEFTLRSVKKVSGGIPQALFTKVLKKFVLSGLSLAGSIPPSLCTRSPALELLQLYATPGIAFNVSAANWTACRNLKNLELYSDSARTEMQYFGAFPSNLSLPVLEDFRVSTTAVGGFLPSVQWARMQLFAISNQGFEGLIGTEMFQSSSVTLVIVDCRPPNKISFSSSLPLQTPFEHSTTMEEFEVRGCSQFTGTISAELFAARPFSFSRIVRLDLEDLHLESLPVALWSINKLTQFSAVNCSLTTVFPDDFDSYIRSRQLAQVNFTGNPLPCPGPSRLWCLEAILGTGLIGYPPCGDCPLLLNATSTGSSITISWAALNSSSADGGELLGYTVFRSTEQQSFGIFSCAASINISIPAAPFPSFTFSGLSSEFDYVIRVSGRYSWEGREGPGITWYGVVPEIATATVTTGTGIPAVAPGAPRFGILTATTVEVIWTPLGHWDIDGVPVSYYVVRAFNASNAEIGFCSKAGMNASSCVVENISPSSTVHASVVGILEVNRYDRMRGGWDILLEETPISTVNGTATTCTLLQKGGIKTCYPCLGPYGCNGTTLCVFPHSGPLCGSCVDGFYFDGSSFKCKECPAFPIVPVLMLPLIALAGYALVRLKQKAVVAGMLFTSVVNTGQLIGVCVNVAMRLPNVLSSIGEGGSYFNLDVGNLHLDCYSFTKLSFEGDYFLTVLVLPGACVGAIWVYERLMTRKHTAVSRKARGELERKRLRKEFLSKKSDLRRILLLLATLYYVRFVTKLVNPFVCTSGVLVADESVSCSSSVTAVTRVISVVLLTAALGGFLKRKFIPHVCGAALPIFIGVKLKRASNRHMLEDLELYSTYGALYSQYTSKHCYFEAIVLLRKAICVNIVFVFLLDVELQLWLLFSACCLYSVMLAAYRPFRRSKRHLFRWNPDIVNPIEVAGSLLVAGIVGSIITVYYSEDALGSLPVGISTTVVCGCIAWLAAIIVLVVRELRRGFEDANLQVQGEELLLEVDRLISDVHRALAMQKFDIAAELKLQLDHLRRKGRTDLTPGEKPPSSLVIPSSSAPIARQRAQAVAVIRGQFQRLLQFKDETSFSNVLFSGWRELSAVLLRAEAAEQIGETRLIARQLENYETICFEQVHQIVAGLHGTCRQEIVQALFSPEDSWDTAKDRIEHLFFLRARLAAVVKLFRKALWQFTVVDCGRLTDGRKTLLNSILARKAAFVVNRRMQDLEHSIAADTARDWCVSMLTEALGFLKTAAGSGSSVGSGVEMEPLLAPRSPTVPPQVQSLLQSLRNLGGGGSTMLNPLCEHTDQPTAVISPGSATLLSKYRRLVAAANRRSEIKVRLKRGGRISGSFLLVGAIIASTILLADFSGTPPALLPPPPAKQADNDTGRCQIVYPANSTVCGFTSEFRGVGSQNQSVVEAEETLRSIQSFFSGFIVTMADPDCVNSLVSAICSLSFQQCNGDCEPLLPCPSVCLSVQRSGCVDFSFSIKLQEVKEDGLYSFYLKQRFSEATQKTIVRLFDALVACNDLEFWSAPNAACSAIFPDKFGRSPVPLKDGICRQPNATVKSEK